MTTRRAEFIVETDGDVRWVHGVGVRPPDWWPIEFGWADYEQKGVKLTAAQWTGLQRIMKQDWDLEGEPVEVAPNRVRWRFVPRGGR